MTGTGRRYALDDVRVVEFTGFAAGPLVGKYLADFGATVLRVESRARPDGFRTHYPPYKDDVQGLERSGTYALCNNNKYGVALNLRHPKALPLAKRMAAWADIVVENFTPGTMKRLGLSYEDMCSVNPDLIMLSSCNQGQTGPHASHPGFGSHLSSLAGFTALTGYPDREPAILYGPYIDLIGAGFGVIAVLAALDYRRRTGKGQYIDLSQYEAGLQFLTPTLLEFTVNGRVMERAGNRHHYAAPHGAYRCRGEERWCVLSVFTDEEWGALAKAMGEPEWARDSRYGTILGRKAHEGELDPLIEEWTLQHTPEEVLHTLQKAGVRAGIVQNVADLFSDPQLRHRGVWWGLDHPELRKHHGEGPPAHLSKTPAESRMRCPLLGEHNRYVYTQLLGLPEGEFLELQAEGVID